MPSVLEAAPMPIGGQTPKERFCIHARRIPEPRLDELLGTLAHELRSPLAAILNATDLIADEYEIEPAARRFLAAIERQSRQALQIVDDIFDVCVGTEGKLSLRKEVVELAEIVTEATETVGHLLAARRHRLTVSLPPEPVPLEADPLRLVQVLTNLLGNAAKYTEPGGDIWLTAEVEASEIVLRVRDNGRGIDPNLLLRVFDLYYQVPRSVQQVAGGLGIGLALVKSLVELHGGAAAAYSDGPGTGCEFVVRLPARQC